MRDGRIIAEHRVQDPVSEDLWDLAHSDLGAALIARDAQALASTPFCRQGALTPTAEDLASHLERSRKTERPKQ